MRVRQRRQLPVFRPSAPAAVPDPLDLGRSAAAASTAGAISSRVRVTIDMLPSG